MTPQHPVNPGSRMTPEEWDATARVRRELIDSVGHEAWSKMTVDQCDEAVRVEGKKRTAGGAAA